MRVHHRHVMSDSGPNFANYRFDETGHFVEYENEYFHEYLESLCGYKPYFLSSLKKEREILQVETVALLLKEVKEDKKFKNLITLLDHWSCVAEKSGWNIFLEDSFTQTVKLLGKYASHLSQQEVLVVMASLNSLGFRKSVLSFCEPRRNRILLSKILDRVCCKNLKTLDIRDMLLAADFFYSVRGSSFTEFPLLMCERMNFYLPELTKHELILLLFHAGLTRKAFSQLIDVAVVHLQQYMNSMTLQELAIINLAHYKTRSSLNHPSFFVALTRQLEGHGAKDLDPICLAALLKYQQKSLHSRKQHHLPQFFSTIKELENPLLPRMSTLPSETLMHVLNLYYSLDVLSEEMYLAVINRILTKGVKDWRLKDIARVTHILANIPLGEEKRMEALAAILVDLQRADRVDERRIFPESLLQVAVSLTFCGVYPHWLAEEIFGDVSQRKFKASEIDFRGDLFHVSESIAIEDSTYLGPHLGADNLPYKTKNRLYSKLLQTRGGRKVAGSFLKLVGTKMTTASNLYQRDYILLDLMDAIIEARPAVSVQPAFLLSHFYTPDIEIYAAPNHRKQSSYKTGQLSDLDLVSESVVLHAHNAYQIVRRLDGTTMPLLRQYHAMRTRQLRRLGVVVIEVPYFELEKIDNKCQYVLKKFKDEEASRLGIQLD